jgi:hypothetical protein
MSLARFCAIGLVAMATGGGCSAALASPWGRPHDLSPANGLGIDPSVGIDRAGHAYAAWLENSSSVFEEVVMVSDRPPRGAWSTPKALSPRGGLAIPVQIAVSTRGDAVVVWGDNQAGIVRASFRARGGGWGRARAVSRPGAQASQPAVALDGHGNAVAAWVAASDGGDRVQVASRRRSKRRWARPATLRGGGDCFLPRVASNARGRAAIVWTCRASNGRDWLYAGTGHVGGRRWRVRKLGSESAGAGTSTAPKPDVAVDARVSATAVWTAEAGNEIVSRLHRRGAAHWSRLRHASRGQPGFHPSVAAAPKGGAEVAWAAADGQRADAVAARRVGYGPWRAPVLLSRRGVDNIEPKVATDAAGRAVAVWDRAVFEEDPPGATSSSGWVVQAASMTARGRWHMPVYLSKPGENAGAPVVALAPRGFGLAAWQRPVGQQGIVVQAAAYAPPRAR